MKTLSLVSAVLAATLSMACGSSDEDTEDPSSSDPAPDDPTGDDDPLVDGLQPCPADRSQQGPEPCVDGAGAVLCRVDTGFPGDELAICEPDPKDGMLLHYGPKDYDDPAQVDLFLLPPGGEDENCTFVVSPNQEEAYVTNYHGRMRPNSHHLILMTLEGDQPASDIPGPCDIGDTLGARWLVGSQDPVIDVAAGGSLTGGDDVPVPGDPDYGLAQILDPTTPIRMDSHYTNPTDQTILREAWVYFDWTEESEVESLADMITFFQLAINIPPQTTFVTERAICTAPTDRYVGLLTGHFHELGTRMSVYRHDLDGNESVVYETYDWADPGNLYFRDGIDVLPANPATGSFGGDHSGYLHMKAGEALSFECEFHNFKSHPVTIGVTALDEMCNTFGMYYPTNGDVWSCRCAGADCTVR